MEMEIQEVREIQELGMFLQRGKSDILGHKTETLDLKEYVTKIWCKLCAKYRDQIVSHPILKGVAVTAVKAIADGTEAVTKLQVSLTTHHLYENTKISWNYFIIINKLLSIFVFSKKTIDNYTSV